jgi:hypothetical protein
MKQKIEAILANCYDRFDLSIGLINCFQLTNIAEIGVLRGNYSEKILKGCEQIEKYKMIDPWRNLSNWNKPANKDNESFERFYQETLIKTDFAKSKIEILRGKTTEVIGQIDEDSLDFIYVDGDHTLKGIAIDLISIWSKVKINGFILGDDFCPSIWQHSQNYEPTLVFPFAVYFAEALNVKIYGLTYNQFLIAKGERGFEFVDLTKKYKNVELRHQLNGFNSRSI